MIWYPVLNRDNTNDYINEFKKTGIKDILRIEMPIENDKIEKIILKIAQIYKDKFYLEIQRHNEEGENDYENYLIKLSSKFNLPLTILELIFTI